MVGLFAAEIGHASAPTNGDNEHINAVLALRAAGNQARARSGELTALCVDAIFGALKESKHQWQSTKSVPKS
jgi:hypothetical protein